MLGWQPSKRGDLGVLNCGRFHAEERRRSSSTRRVWGAGQRHRIPAAPSAAAPGVSPAAQGSPAPPLSRSARSRARRPGSIPAPPPAPPAAPARLPPTLPGRGAQEAGAQGWRCRRARRAGEPGCRPGLRRRCPRGFPGPGAAPPGGAAGKGGRGREGCESNS